MKIEVTYTKAQEEIFFNSKARFLTVTKGRRFGFTRGAAQFVIEELLEGRNWLWVDTVNSNIQRYFERYFMPILRDLPSEIYKWNMQDKKLKLANSYLDMRSADNPENIEGFGYDGVLLNEAGIILNDRYLWENAIRPMMLDNPNSRAIIGGVPKGKNLFFELAQKGISGVKDWEHKSFTSYDNPYINKESIDELIEELGGSENVIKQEIFGQFVDSVTSELFSFDALNIATKRVDVDESGARVWGVDVARFGDDSSVIAKRHGYKVYPLNVYHGLDTIALAHKIKHLYELEALKPHAIFVETNGIGAGVFDLCFSYGLPVLPADVARSSTVESFYNKRMQMYWDLSQALNHLSLPEDRMLLGDLGVVEYFYANNGKMQLESKREMKKKHGRSPDRSDAVALTFYERVHLRVEEAYYEGDTKW